jgi:hypothetical protein
VLEIWDFISVSYSITPVNCGKGKEYGSPLRGQSRAGSSGPEFFTIAFVYLVFFVVKEPIFDIHRVLGKFIALFSF